MLDESIGEEVNFSLVMTMNIVHTETIHIVQMQSDSRSMHVLGKRGYNGDRGHPCELFQPNSKLPLAKKTKNALKDKYFQFIDETNFVPLLC